MVNNYAHTIQENQGYDFSSGYSLELMDMLIKQALRVGNPTLRLINNRTYTAKMTLVREEMTNKIIQIEKDSKNYPYSREVLSMVLERMRRFVKHCKDNIEQLTLKEIVYHLELAHKIQRIDWDNHEIIAFSPVDEQLIYMNYNSRSYIAWLENWLSEHIRKGESPISQLQQVQFYRKAFAQLQRRPEAVLHEDYISLHEVLADWFTHETEYLESQLDIYMKAKSVIAREEQTKNRIRCSLSANPLALILRAADESRVIEAKSLSSMFQAIVPYCSTPNTEELSPGALRSHSYYPEQSDKDVAIKALQKMIKKIEEY